VNLIANLESTETKEKELENIKEKFKNIGEKVNSSEIEEKNLLKNV